MSANLHLLRQNVTISYTEKTGLHFTRILCLNGTDNILKNVA